MNPLADDLDHVLAHTQGLWDELRGQRIFVTGGTGFFGCWLLESFVWANDKLNLGASAVVLTRNPAAFEAKAPHLASHPAIQFHTGDIRSFSFPPGKFSHIIHAATEASAKLNDENPLLMFDTIVEGTRRALELARQSGAKKFLLTSSGAVYGRQPPDLTHIAEDYGGGPDPTGVEWSYGEGKRAAEMLCVLYARQHGLLPKIARCFAFVGPYLPLDMHFAIGNFIANALKGGPIHVNGDGKRPSAAMALEVSVTMRVQLSSAPMPEMTASPAMNRPAHAWCGKIDSKAFTNGDPVPAKVRWSTRPMTAAVTRTYSNALIPVPMTDARRTLRRGSRTRRAVMAAASTPMKLNNATPAAIPMAL